MRTWRWTFSFGDTLWGGGARVAFSCFAGMLIYRVGGIIGSRLGFVPMSILLLGLVYVVMVFVDEPIRRYLKNRMEKRILRPV